MNRTVRLSIIFAIGLLYWTAPTLEAAASVHAEIDVLYRDDAYGAGLYESFKTRFEELGGHCGPGVSYPPQTQDFDAALTALTENLTSSIQDHPLNETAILTVSLDEGVQIFDTLSRMNTLLATLKWYGTDGIAANTILFDSPTASLAAEGVHLTATLMGVENDNKHPQTHRVRYRRVQLGLVVRIVPRQPTVERQ